ncbi:BON domain-containing protein [Fulvimonas sp. R45]|uniref:BON domain-containing protein n=1 Tax=Fulvimonas sp. R45 TaxID=3045937 RepID=UPI00265F4112|nr:BON domain-containing protein [Fulvimonas sp. R45]MDO1527221.1 BON domain-containing protein [Fulvimonas sp. R45]
MNRDYDQRPEASRPGRARTAHYEDPQGRSSGNDYPPSWNDTPSPRWGYVGANTAARERADYQGGRADYGRGSAQEPPHVNHPRYGQRYREAWENNASWDEPWPHEASSASSGLYGWPDVGGGRRDYELRGGEQSYAPDYGRQYGSRHPLAYGPDERQGGAQGRRRGGYAGKGPRGYTRPDERICEDLSDRLTEDPWIDASDIEIAVENGVVALRGQVPERSMKHRAEDCAERVGGVKDVDNRIRVQRDGGGAPA